MYIRSIRLRKRREKRLARREISMGGALGLSVFLYKSAFSVRFIYFLYMKCHGLIDLGQTKN